MQYTVSTTQRALKSTLGSLSCLQRVEVICSNYPDPARLGADCSAAGIQFAAPSEFPQTVPMAPVYQKQSVRRVSGKRSFSHLQEQDAQPSAFAAQKTAYFAGVSPAYHCSTIRTESMDSAVSSTSPLPLAKRQCFQASCPGTPDAFPISRISHAVQHQLQQQQPAPAKLLNQADLHAYQAMLQPKPAAHMSSLAAYLHQVRQLQRAAASHPSNFIRTHQQQQQVLDHEHDMHSHQHQWQQNHQQRQRHLIAQHQSTGCAVQAQQLCSHHLTAQPSSDMFDSFIHQLLGIRTPAQHQERLLPLQDRQQTGGTAEPASKPSLCWQAAAGQVIRNSAQHLEHHQPTNLLLSFPAEVQQPNSSNRLPQESLQHLLRLQHHAQAQRQPAPANRTTMLQQCLSLRRHAAQTAQQQLPARAPFMGFAELLLYWARSLALQRPESLHLACHLWQQVQHQVSIAYMHLLGAERPWETMLLGCLWVASKLEECRRGVPTATRVGLLVGLDKTVMSGVELYLMQLVNWAPLRGWQISRV